MSILEKLSSQLPKEMNESVAAIIQEENAKMLDRLQILDERLTNANFLANGAGAVAVLAYFANYESTFALNLALLCFSIGVIATSIERRALLNYFSAVSKDNSRRNRLYWDDKISLREFSEIPEQVGHTWKLVNHYSGLVSQSVFVIGVISGVAAFTVFGN